MFHSLFIIYLAFWAAEHPDSSLFSWNKWMQEAAGQKMGESYRASIFPLNHYALAAKQKLYHTPILFLYIYIFFFLIYLFILLLRALEKSSNFGGNNY